MATEAHPGRTAIGRAIYFGVLKELITAHVAVVNEGIAGNRLLSDGPATSLGVSALARFDRDALSVPGITDIVLLEGTNDIGFPGATLGDLSLAHATDAPAVEDIIGAYPAVYFSRACPRYTSDRLYDHAFRRGNNSELPHGSEGAYASSCQSV